MHHRVVLYRDAGNQWRWRRVAANGRITADSGEGYVRQVDCLDSAKAVNAMPYILEFEGGTEVEFDFPPPVLSEAPDKPTEGQA